MQGSISVSTHPPSRNLWFLKVKKHNIIGTETRGPHKRDLEGFDSFLFKFWTRFFQVLNLDWTGLDSLNLDRT